MSPRDSASSLLALMKKMADPERARISRTFFKTGPGQYGEGDIFIGITVPQIRTLVRDWFPLDENALLCLLHSPIHEARMLALLLWVQTYAKGGTHDRERIYLLYLENTRWINNWDLVDSSAEQIVGAHLMSRDRSILDTLAGSPLLWDRRISIVSTFYFIRRHEFVDTLRIAELLINDSEDLIHKAVGWMLREIGKRDQTAEKTFLDQYACCMPRTMLRYAIEHFPENERRRYLNRRKSS